MQRTNPLEFTNFSKIYRVFLQMDSHLKTAYSISFEQYRIMAYILSLESKKASVSEVSRHFESSSPAISRKIRVLFNLNYMVGHADSKDHRVHWLNITPAGKQLALTVNNFLNDRIPELKIQIDSLLKDDLKN